jgi:hypothetical protein
MLHLFVLGYQWAMFQTLNVVGMWTFEMEKNLHWPLLRKICTNKKVIGCRRFMRKSYEVPILVMNWDINGVQKFFRQNHSLSLPLDTITMRKVHGLRPLYMKSWILRFRKAYVNFEQDAETGRFLNSRCGVSLANAIIADATAICSRNGAIMYVPATMRSL